MDMDVSFIIVLFAIGIAGSLISGMVGIGGAIINFPLLLYVPPALGFEAFSLQEVSAITAIQVFSATLSGIVVYKKSGLINKALVINMGSAIIVGSFIGGYGSNFLPDATISTVYGILATIAAVMMFMPKKKVELLESNDLVFNKKLAASFAIVIGIASGIVGAAGAFITVPVMLVILKIPTRIAIASSLAITFISSIGTTAGKLMGGHMLLVPAIVIVIASTFASPLGAMISKKLHTKTLQLILSLLICITVVKIWFNIFL
ncbi:hypothetical protein BK133_12480 [Paenibacillus sp. FSL H8-0548]|uniref:sulfite exporter TauE/SafE family protein n=1 Tax=Paenibacillus sp. FSL H8-0548 TaxID=1920422 RepID=UPI00096EA1D5|nr:sulfite exporter TauE/SafE family protein [Paenibacillus sp. FSL H8-0548]OMF34603.1 hypothetical protein BK133_12480 [Paenibacillus sp. FSL H8-0548]